MRDVRKVPVSNTCETKFCNHFKLFVSIKVVMADKEMITNADPITGDARLLLMNRICAKQLTLLKLASVN